MSRSVWKGPFYTNQLRCSDNLNLKQNKIISVWSRNSMILPEDVGKSIQIYNGKFWSRRKIVEDMVGHKFGEFSHTKKKTIHKINKIRQISSRK